MPSSEHGDPLDFFSDSLETLYGLQPISLTTSGIFIFTLKSCFTKNHASECSCSVKSIALQIPDPEARNWALHASSIWASSIYLADHLDELKLEDYFLSKQSSVDKTVRVLELGASAGLPGISIAKLHSESGLLKVTVSDYPDEFIMKTLSDNVTRNGSEHCCKALPHAWGTSPTSLFEDGVVGFDLVIAADTLWNPELHAIFITTLQATLKRSLDSRIHLVVGLHTGRYLIQSFLEMAKESEFDLKSISERRLSEAETRHWEVSRDREDETGRRRWVVWIQLGWARK